MGHRLLARATPRVLPCSGVSNVSALPHAQLHLRAVFVMHREGRLVLPEYQRRAWTSSPPRWIRLIQTSRSTSQAAFINTTPTPSLPLNHVHSASTHNAAQYHGTPTTESSSSRTHLSRPPPPRRRLPPPPHHHPRLATPRPPLHAASATTTLQAPRCLAKKRGLPLPPNRWVRQCLFPPFLLLFRPACARLGG